MLTRTFFALCENHDWYHAMSDSHAVYQRGRDSLNELTAIANVNPIFKNILNAFHNYAFTGEAWNNKKAPYPMLTDYIDSTHAIFNIAGIYAYNADINRQCIIDTILSDIEELELDESIPF